MRRNLAIYTHDDQLVTRVWVAEDSVSEVEARYRAAGYRVVDVERMGRFELDEQDPPSHLDHLLRNP